MPWPQHPGETTGIGSRMTPADWNNARQIAAAWTDVALSASAITIAGDGKFRVTYSGAQNLDNINGTSHGDIIFLSADAAGAGGTLTIRHNQGNIRLNAGVNITIDDNSAFALFIHMGALVVGGLFYEP